MAAISCGLETTRRFDGPWRLEKRVLSLPFRLSGARRVSTSIHRPLGRIPEGIPEGILEGIPEGILKGSPGAQLRVFFVLC